MLSSRNFHQTISANLPDALVSFFLALTFFNNFCFIGCSFHKGKVAFLANILRVVRLNIRYMVDSARTDESFNSFNSVYGCCFQLKKSFL